MDNNMCFLITILVQSEKTLVRCALKVSTDLLTNDIILYPMEPENRQVFHQWLPAWVSELGDIVEIIGIHEISYVTT